MNYLLPIPYNYSKIINYDCSELAIDSSTRKEIKNWVRDKLTNANIYINTDDKQKSITSLAIAVLNSIAIIFLPKFIVLGCTAISAVAYIELARMLEDKIGVLKNTLITKKIIQHLADPNQQGQKFTEALEKIEQELKDLEKASLNNKKLFGEDLSPNLTLKLKNDLEKKKVNLKSQLEDFKNDLPYFQRNADSLTKLADIWQKIAQNDENKVTAYRDFIFYSLIGIALINIDRLKELIGKLDYARYISYPSLIIALGAVSIAYAAKQAFTILAHKNDQVKKQELLATITEDKIKNLLECFP